MSRLGLRTQLILLLFGALAAAQGIAAWLFLDERAMAVRLARAEEVAARTLALADTLDSAAASAQATLAERAGGRGVRFSLNRSPLSAAAGTEPLPRLAARLAPEGRSLRVALTRDVRDARPDRGHGARQRSDRLVISAALAGGGWLDAEARLRPPPLQWAGPALASALLAALGMAVVVWVSIGRLTQPMRALARAADTLGSGERPDPLPLSGPPEIRRVTDAFNVMAERLTRLLDERAGTLAAIGHDLRSPITAMRLRIEMVDDDETRERLSASVAEIQTLVEGALALARGGGADEKVTSVDLTALLGTLAAVERDGGADVTLSADAPAFVRGRPHALKRAFRNIVENAVRYGERARITVERKNGVLRVVVEDDGPGVPEAERTRIFEPFVRLEASRSRNTGGSGLGLAIARTVIEGHGGTLTLDAAPGAGARVVAQLSTAERASSHAVTRG